MLKIGWNPFRKKAVTTINKIYDTELTKLLKPGDIVLFRADMGNLLSALICKYTYSCYSHVELYIGDGWCVGASLYGVKYDSRLGRNKGFVDIFRTRKPLTKLEKRVLIGKAHQSVGRPYDFSLLLAFPWITNRSLVRRSADLSFVCSELAAWCFDEANRPLFEKPTAAVAPVCYAANPEIERVYSVYNGKLRYDTEINVIDPAQGTRNPIVKYLIKYILKPTSKRHTYFRDKLALNQAIIDGDIDKE